MALAHGDAGVGAAHMCQACVHSTKYPAPCRRSLREWARRVTGLEDVRVWWV
eukprot:SAG11_NODE_26285_length_347_cov_0.830645_1_plen_51_part_10